MQYCTARGTDLGTVADKFDAACHQMDRADLILADLRDRNRHGTRRRSGQASPDTDGPLITILARHDPQSQITVLVLDSVTDPPSEGALRATSPLWSPASDARLSPAAGPGSQSDSSSSSSSPPTTVRRSAIKAIPSVHEQASHPWLL